MANVIIPPKHQSAPTNGAPAPKQSILRQLQNKVVGVTHHNGLPVREVNVLTSSMVYGIDQGLLDEAFRLKTSTHPKRRGLAKLLLQILGAVDYAGRQHRPVMLVGERRRRGGFTLKLVVPIDTSARPGAPPETGGGDGVEREG